MVSSELLWQANKWLNEILGISGNTFFSDVRLVCGDFFQLTLIKRTLDHISSKSIRRLLALEICKKFKMVELAEVMGQKGDYDFVTHLNWICVGQIDEDIELFLKPKFLNVGAYPQYALHILAEDVLLLQHNEIQLTNIDTRLVRIKTINEIRKGITQSEVWFEAISKRKIKETFNLASQLNLNNGVQVVLTANINIEDRLVNGQVAK